jgi:hypothetical protein
MGVMSGKGWRLPVYFDTHVKKNSKSLHTDARKALWIIGFSDSATCTILLLFGAASAAAATGRLRGRGLFGGATCTCL